MCFCSTNVSTAIISVILKFSEDVPSCSLEDKSIKSVSTRACVSSQF